VSTCPATSLPRGARERPIAFGGLSGTNQGIPDWAREGELPAVGNSVQDHGRRGADRRGAAGVRDGDAALLRRRSGTLRLLMQGETRKTKRVRLFTEFVSRRLAAYVPLLAGLSYCRD
jgi:hypothetical protein